MFLSRHVHVLEWIHTLKRMSRDSLLEAGAKSEVYVTETGLDSQPLSS